LGFFDVSNHDTAELLRPDQVDKFSDGLPSYYEHIIELYNQIKESSHVAEFANLALQAHNMAIGKAQEVCDMSPSSEIITKMYAGPWRKPTSEASRGLRKADTRPPRAPLQGFSPDG
jgi:hypothetical protein